MLYWRLALIWALQACSGGLGRDGRAYREYFSENTSLAPG